MDWKDVAGTVAKAAPMLGTLLGGPAGAAVGALVASALGTAADPDEVAAAVANPEAAAKLRQIEADRQVRLQELVEQHAAAVLQHEATMAATDAADRASARQTQIAVHSRMPAVLGVLVTAGFFGVLGVMLAGLWKPNDNNALLLLLGSLGTSWGAIVNFYFGSSASSARKDQLISQGTAGR